MQAIEVTPTAQWAETTFRVDVVDATPHHPPVLVFIASSGNSYLQVPLTDADAAQLRATIEHGRKEFGRSDMK